MKKKLMGLYEKYTPILIIVALFTGIFLAKYIPLVLELANNIVEKLIDGITFLAPFAIFIVLAPSLAKMIKTRKESSFAGFVVIWFAITRILAGIWAAIFTFLILGLPLLPTQYNNEIMSTMHQSLLVLKNLMLHNMFFWAIWASIVVGIIAYKHKKIYNILSQGTKAIETIGGKIESFIPILMLLLGAYIYSLPTTLKESIDSATMSSIASSSSGLSLLGLHINIDSEFGLIWIYILGSILIGIGCFIWQIMQLGILKKFVKGFSIKDFFKKYWLKVYPLAWSTSSEVVSMPLNMAIIKEKYHNIDKKVRRLVVGLGSYLNINGTTMHVILLAGIVAIIIGYKPSLFELLISVPLIVLIGYGVPGVPGELVLFAVPMVKMLNLPEPLIPMFMALYLALQVGLPDSFRTGANVTDNGIYAIGLNKIYYKFAEKAEYLDVREMKIIEPMLDKCLKKNEDYIANAFLANQVFQSRLKANIGNRK